MSRSVVGLLLLLILTTTLVLQTSQSMPYTFPAFNNTTTDSTTASIGIKALAIVPSTGLYQAPYIEQVAINIMRDWGIPFDLVSISSVNSATFWDYSTNSTRYQFAVYFGSSSVSTEGTDPPTAVEAINGAIANGTNFLFVGPAVVSYEEFLGLSGYSDCPSQPQNGNGVCGETLEFGVMHNFSGIVPGSPTYHSGQIFSTAGVPLQDIAMPQVNWNGTGTEFLNATVGNNNIFEPNVIYRNYHGSNLWWWGGTEGQYSFYREGWQQVFYNTVDAYQMPQLFAAAFEPEIDLFYYILNNITTYKVGILPWSNGGSAEVIRAEDHASMCQYTQCGADTGVIKMLLNMGLVGEINVDLNGWSDSIEHTVQQNVPQGAIPPPNSYPGYVYYGNLGSDWGNTYFAIAAVVDNKSSTVPISFTSVVTGGSLSQVLNFMDGNTTEISQISLLVNTTPSTVWNIELLSLNGSALYTSPNQYSQIAKPTWVNFSVQAQGNQQSNGVPNSLQTNLALRLNVISGTVDWWHGQNQMDYIVVGRSNWDIVYIAKVGTDNFTNSVPLVPDSILMANGNPYPQDNKTIVLDPQDNMTYPGELHPADIVGENNIGLPNGANFEVFFTIYDWEHYGMKAMDNFQSLAAKGWVVDPNGWTHAKDPANDVDNDFRFGNGAVMSPALRMERIDSIITYFNTLLGPGNWSKYWAFGTDPETFYPAMQQLYDAGFTYAQLASEYSSTLDYFLSGYWKTGVGGLYSLGQTEKAVNGVSWTNAVTFNETREELGVISTHSDSNYPYIDYVLASEQGWTGGFGLQDTWFCGTTTRCFAFWNTTRQLLMNQTADFTFKKTANLGTLSIVVYIDHLFINSSSLNDPLVFRVPDNLGGLYLETIGDNASKGNLAPQEGGDYYYYVIKNGSGWLNITATYGTQKRVVGQTIEVTLLPSAGSSPINSSNTFELTYIRNETSVSMKLNPSTSKIVVDPGSSMIISGATEQSNQHQMWVLLGTFSPVVVNLSNSFMNNFTFHYYELFNLTFSAKPIFGEAPLQFNISYATLSPNGSIVEVTTKLGGATSAWMLRGSSWNVTPGFIYQSGMERWVLVGTPNGIVNGSYLYSEYYYHQYLQTIGFSMVYGNSLVPPSVLGYQRGNLTLILLNQVSTGYWFDARGSINLTNPIYISGSERWISDVSSILASRPNHVNITYVHQFHLSFNSSNPNEGTLPESGWYNATLVRVYTQPLPGYKFVRWSSDSPLISVQNPDSPSTTIDVNGAGTLTLWFSPSSNYYPSILVLVVTSVLALITIVYSLIRRSRKGS